MKHKHELLDIYVSLARMIDTKFSTKIKTFQVLTLAVNTSILSFATLSLTRELFFGFYVLIPMNRMALLHANIITS